MIAEQRANWLKDEQKRNHLETSIQSATQQTKAMMESMKGNAFRAAVILQVDKSKRPILSADDGLLPATDSQIVSNYVPKPEISQASIPYLKFLSGDKIQTAKNPKSDEWLNNFFEDLMSCKVCTRGMILIPICIFTFCVCRHRRTGVTNYKIFITMMLEITCLQT